MKAKIRTDLKDLFKLSTPIMIGMFMQTLFTMVDLYFVARLGNHETAAVALGSNVLWTMIALTMFVTSGTTAIISRAIGKKDHDNVKRFAGLTTMLSLIFGVLLGFMMFQNAKGLVALLFAPEPQTLTLVVAYLQVLFIGFVAFFVGSNGRSIIQATGDTMSPLVVFGLANLVNILLDPVFIFYFDMGIQGAALATVLANLMACGMIYALVVKRLFKGQIKPFIKAMALDLQGVIDISKIGFWDLLQSIARPITGMMMFRMVYDIGKETATAAFGIGGQLFNYTFIILIGLSMSLSIITGQALGEGNPDKITRLMKEAFWIGGLNLLVFGVPYLLLAAPVFEFFRDDPVIVAQGVNYLRWVYPGVIFVVFPMILGGISKGAGATREPMIASLVANVLIKLPLGYILAYHTTMGLNGIWLAISLSVVSEALLMILSFKKGHWRKTKAYVGG